jgi:hypothetical protein
LKQEGVTGLSSSYSLLCLTIGPCCFWLYLVLFLTFVETSTKNGIDEKLPALAQLQTIIERH